MAEEKTQKTTNEMEDARIYELAFILSPFLAEESVAQYSTSLQEKITKAGGEMISQGDAAIRDLAYEISTRVDGKTQKFTKGYFGWIKFEMEPEKAVELNDEVKNSKDVIRTMMILTVREDTFIPREPDTKLSLDPAPEPEILSIDREAEESGPVDEEKVADAIEELVIE